MEQEQHCLYAGFAPPYSECGISTLQGGRMEGAALSLFLRAGLEHPFEDVNAPLSSVNN